MTVNRRVTKRYENKNVSCNLQNQKSKQVFLNFYFSSKKNYLYGAWSLYRLLLENDHLIKERPLRINVHGVIFFICHYPPVYKSVHKWFFTFDNNFELCQIQYGFNLFCAKYSLVFVDYWFFFMWNINCSKCTWKFTNQRNLLVRCVINDIIMPLIWIDTTRALGLLNF